MTYLRLIMYSTGKFLEEFPIKLLFITILTKDSTTAWYITFKNWTLIQIRGRYSHPDYEECDAVLALVQFTISN